LDTGGIFGLGWTLAAACGGSVAGWLGWHYLSRARELEDAPQSRIRSAAQGYVQLLGRARLMPGPPILSPLSGTPCVWWHCRVVDTSDKHNDVLIDAASEDLFYLSDTTGDCIVDPVGANVEPNISRSWRGHARKPLHLPRSRWDAFFSSGKYRYSEQLVTEDALLTAKGWFRTQAAVQASDESRDLAALLGDWKRDRGELLRRFDANHNGRIDPEEWETARTAALEEIRALRAEQQALPDLDVLGRPPDQREFLLAAVPRQTLLERYRLRGRVLIGAAAMAALSLLLTLHGRHWP